MFGTLEHGALRAVSVFNNFMVFLSAAIATGILSSFLSDSGFRGTHIVYMEVIAVITMVWYLVAMILPCLPFYRGFLSPMHMIFSYLWLTSFIFAAQTWSGHWCRTHLPLFGSCGRKHALEAFTFLAFFFLLCNMVVEALLWRAHRKERDTTPHTHNGVKERPHTGQTAETTSTTV